MTPELEQFLFALHQDGVAHDLDQPDRLLRRRNLEQPTAELLCTVLRIGRARDVVEIGTSNAYSTIWLAQAAGDTGGRVVSVDTGDQSGARANLLAAGEAEPGLERRVEFLRADGGAYLAGLNDASVDLLFLDAERVQYPGWWPHPARVVRPGGVIAVDNVISHPDEAAPFLRLLAAEPSFACVTVAVGKGLHLAWKRRGPV